MQPNKINKFFPLQVWLTSVIVVGPLLGSIGGFIEDPTFIKTNGQLSLTILIMIFGLLYSMPVFIASFFSYIYLAKHFQSATIIKIIFVLICLFGIFLTFLKIADQPLIGFAYYSSSVIISSLFFKIYKRVNVN